MPQRTQRDSFDAVDETLLAEIEKQRSLETGCIQIRQGLSSRNFWQFRNGRQHDNHFIRHEQVQLLSLDSNPSVKYVNFYLSLSRDASYFKFVAKCFFVDRFQ